MNIKSRCEKCLFLEHTENSRIYTCRGILEMLKEKYNNLPNNGYYRIFPKEVKYCDIFKAKE